jgi:hypothetical protein
VAALLVGAGIAAVTISECREPPKSQPAVTVPPRAYPNPEAELAERYSPIYELRMQDEPCDTNGEAFEPAPVELVVGQEDIILRQKGRPPITGPTMADLVAADNTAYLDYPGDPRDPGCQYDRDFRRFMKGLQPTVYARIAFEPGKPGLALQYWSFYYFNDWNNKHEGDWEMVELVFNEETVEGALRSAPSFAAYAQHGSGERAEWTTGKIQKDGDHPYVYVSAGSHASYFRPATYLGVGEQGAGLGCDVATPPQRWVSPAVVLMEPPDQLPVPWLAFRGSWGELAGGEFDGPTGPQTKRVWRSPLTWAEATRGGSATVPGGDILGVNAVRSFCRTVEFGSRALRTYLRYPVLVGGSLSLLLGASSVAGLVVVRDLGRRPLIGRDTEGFLRHRRSTGQMIRAATIVYLREPRLFLGISFGFIPLAIGLSLIQDWLLSQPPFD